MSFVNLLPPREAAPKAKAAAAKALEIDGSLAQAHISLAYVSFTYDWDWAAATEHFDRAIALDRDAVMNHSLLSLLSHGRWPVAGSRRGGEARAGARSDFGRAEPYAGGAAGVWPGGWTKGSRSAAGRWNSIPISSSRTTCSAPRSPPKVRYPEGLPAAEKAAALSGGAALPVADLGYIHARLGHGEEARRLLQTLVATSTQRYTPAVTLAIVHVGLDENERALDWLDKAYEERSIRLAY